MRKNSSKNHSIHQRNDSGSLDKDSTKSFQTKNISISPLSLGTLGSNTTHYMDSEFETLSQKQSKGQTSVTNYENQYFRLTNEIREMYIEMKNSAIKNDPNCALVLKKLVPMDQDDISHNNDPLETLRYIKKVFDKVLEFKNDAEEELNAKNKGECSDYESMLQKLEAEVRQHIRIEQQLKLYVESTQAKLDELEKVYDPVKAEATKKEMEDLKNENGMVHDKLKRRDNEIEQYKKEISNKNSFIKDLEHQVENMPALKNKIRDLEKMLNNSGARPPSANVLKGSNKYNKEENFDKNSSFTNAYSSGDNKVRKSSQPSLNMSACDIPKAKNYDKENMETYKIDLAKHMYESLKGYRSNSHGEVQKSTENSRLETSMFRNSSKREEKGDDFSTVLEKMKKTLRSGHSRNSSKDNLRGTEHTINPEEILEHDAKAFDSKKSTGAGTRKDVAAESSKYNYDKKMRSGNYSQAWDKPEYRDSKDLQHKLGYYKDMGEPENHQRNSIPRPRPSTGGGHHDSSYIDYTKYKREQEAYDLNKLKVNSPKKMSQDRSQSVDAKSRLKQQTKSTNEHLDKTVDYDMGRPSLGSYNAYISSHNQTRKILS